MFRNKSVNLHQFAMIPKADIPRSAFLREWTHKTAFSSGYLIPIVVDEVLPGDTMSLHMTLFARMATPIYPIMDNLHISSFFFFVPNRLLWTNWKKFQGEQDNPADSVAYTVPVSTSPASGYLIGTLHDYMGLPTLGQVTAAATVSHSNLHLRAYNKIWNEWFRDQNLQNSVTVDTGDGPDTYSNYVLLRRGKRHDYFTSSLPWPQKGTAVSMPLGTRAPVVVDQTTGGAIGVYSTSLGAYRSMDLASTFVAVSATANANATSLYADLNSATSATINQIRSAFQIQKLLERDARGGTRYVESLRVRFGVVNPDFRLQRSEYLGGGRSPVSINPIAQTSATGVTGGSTPTGQLAAMGTALAQGHGFTQAFTEHGVILGLVSIQADLTYQQGLERFWSRSTRYDFYEPVFAHLGEQSVYQKEIYCTGGSGDSTVFGYQERWAEYRYKPSIITGIFRSTAASTLDAWHLAQKFTSAPTLNSTFIQDTPPVARVIAVPSQPEFICDSFFSCRTVRAMPMYSVPGQIDRF